VNYEFPVIEHIDQFEPIIAKNPAAYYKTDKGDYVTFNYSSLNPNNFPPVENYEDAFIREARGIAFLKSTGKIISRPFHKFFNLGERDETDIDVMNYIGAQVAEKLDGSMIHALDLPQGPRLATRAGITDVSLKAERFIAANAVYQDFIHDMVKFGFTPIFEFVSPDNKIVINYQKPRLVLLAIRNRFIGEYATHLEKNLQGYEGIPLPKVWDGTSIEEIRAWEGQEGVVVTLVNGHRVKIKADAYVRLHRYIDIMKSDRHFVIARLSENWDDIYSNAAPEVKDKLKVAVKQFEWFTAGDAEDIIKDIEDNFDDLIVDGPVRGFDVFDLSDTRAVRKSYAEWVFAHKDRKEYASVYFKVADQLAAGIRDVTALINVAQHWITIGLSNKTKSVKDWETNNRLAQIPLLPREFQDATPYQIAA